MFCNKVRLMQQPYLYNGKNGRKNQREVIKRIHTCRENNFLIVVRKD